MQPFPRSVLCAAVVLAAPIAAAEELTHTVPFLTPQLTGASTSWQAPLSFPRFDPDLGHLEAVSIELIAVMTGSLGVENTAATETTPNTHVRAHASATSHAGPVYSTPWCFDLFAGPTLAPYDGTTDFAGPSGATASFTDLAGTPGTSTKTFAFSVTQFLGPAGAPGEVEIDVHVSRLVQTIPVSATLVTTAEVVVDGTLELTYHYTTATTRICIGDPDAGWGSCPCGWGGGSSCGNSVNTLGAAMGWTGTASIANDTLVFGTYGLPNSSAILLQGDQLTTQTAFGDGIRCVDGNILRLGTTTIASGQTFYPGPGQLPISVRGQVSEPGTRYYQTYYRNAANYCTPATANASDGLAVHWTP
jgi:hypothetical protein